MIDPNTDDAGYPWEGDVKDERFLGRSNLLKISR